MRKIAERFISFVLWRWTADGVNEDGVVTQDYWKYNVKNHASTRAAKELIKRSNAHTGLRHEHVVPRKVLIKRILEQKLCGEDLFVFLCVFCKAAIITKEEDSMLRPKSGMPAGWCWDENDIYVRYRNSGINLQYLSD